MAKRSIYIWMGIASTAFDCAISMAIRGRCKVLELLVISIFHAILFSLRLNRVHLTFVSHKNVEYQINNGNDIHLSTNQPKRKNNKQIKTQREKKFAKQKSHSISWCSRRKQEIVPKAIYILPSFAVRPLFTGVHLYCVCVCCAHATDFRLFSKQAKRKKIEANTEPHRHTRAFETSDQWR